VTYGHASGSRVHGAFKHDNRCDDIFSDLPCLCPICAVTKSETPGHRKFERHFQHADIDVTKVQGDYLIVHDPRMQEAINTLRDMDLCSLPPAHTVPETMRMRRRSRQKKIAAEPPKYSNQLHIKRLLFTSKRITACQH
jgi:hypothetical protein